MNRRAHDCSNIQRDAMIGGPQDQRLAPVGLGFDCLSRSSRPLRYAAALSAPFKLGSYFPEYRALSDLIPQPVLAPPFRTFAKSWLASLSTMAHSTRVSYERSLNRYWLPFIGDRPIDTIRHSDLQLTLGKFEFATAKTTP